MKTNSNLLALSLTFGSLMVLSACPRDPIVQPTPTPTPSVYVTPTPTPTPTPIPTATPLGALNVLELANGNLVSDSFKLDFGPGSKGVKLDFGPGSKGNRTEFGPGTKGPKNLEFNLSLPASLTDPNLAPFAIAQQGIGGRSFLSDIRVEFIRDNQVYATASVLPRRTSIDVDARFHPGQYSVQVVAQTLAGPLQMSYSHFEILADFKAAFKVEIYANAENTVKPEDLDVAILSQPRQQQLDLSAYPTISASPSPQPDTAASASPSPQPDTAASASPSPTPSPFASANPTTGSIS